ncbi:MAG: hypothetical protein AVDCRST_MAG49-2464, partial [uncultured Thermomicrobiales bacterium]
GRVDPAGRWGGALQGPRGWAARCPRPAHRRDSAAPGRHPGRVAADRVAGPGDDPHPDPRGDRGLGGPRRGPRRHRLGAVPGVRGPAV